MKKLLFLLALLCLFAQGAWADGPFTFTNWVYNSYTRVGGTEGTATYVCNAPIYMEQKGVTITNTGNLTISFQYTSGGKRLEIYGVELIGSESKTAFEHKYAGSYGTPAYTLSNVAVGTYTLRIWSSEYGDGNSYLLGGGTNGNITYSGDAASGANLTITSWSKDNWKKSGAAIPTEVSSTIKAKGWKSYNNIHYKDDENLTFSAAKTYNINYNYTGADGGGNERMDIRGVEVLDESGNVVACDYHEGYTGNAASNRDYKLEVPAGTYTVRTLVQTGNANDVRCKGNVTYSVIDGSAIATNYTTNIKPNLYDNSVLKIGAPVQSYLTALETAIEGGNDLAIEAAYNAAMTTNNLNLPSGYYYMKSMDMTSANNVAVAPYAYNDYNFNGNTSHKTLMTATTGANNTIWKVTNNGATISILNGDGKGINNGTNYTTLNFGNFKATQFVNWGAKGIYFTQGIHASNQSHLKINGVVALTGWAHDDSQGSAWEFIPVDDPNIYNVVVTGADGYVTLNGTNGYAYNGGFFNAASITESDLTAQEIDGLNSKIEVNGNTIIVTYTEEAAPVELTSGYYYIKNKASNKYLVNNYNFSTTTTLSGSKVTTNNGVWKVDVNDNGTITLKNGIATPLYVGGTSITKLTFGGTPLTSGVYFTKKIDGSGDALAIGSEEAPATTWVFEPIADDSKIVDVIINGDNGEGVVSYNGQKATNSGFFVLAAGASVAGFSSNDIGGKEKSEIKHLTVMPYYIDVEYYVYNDDAVRELQTLIDEIVPNVQNNEIGYPKSSNSEVNTAYADIWWYYNDNTLLTSGNSEEKQTRYTSALQSARTIANCSDINLPTPGGFYTLTNADGSVTKTYYIKEGSVDNLSQLICYENGQFAKISNDFTSVDFSAIGTASGKDFAFMAARTNEKGMPINLGKVCVWQSGEGPLPSGDGNIYSGWTIRKQNALTVNLPASSYTTFYAPVAMQVSENLKVYTARVDEGNAHVTFNELTNGKIPARTGVLIAGNKEDLTDKSITVLSESVDEQESDLKGAEYTQSYALGDNSGYKSTLNGESIDWHAYTLQSGTWKRYTGTKLSGFKAHFELKDLGHAGVKAYTFSFGDDVVTSISDLFGTTQPKQVFDLSGRQVNKAQRGLYIVNGKKVLR